MFERPFAVNQSVLNVCQFDAGGGFKTNIEVEIWTRFEKSKNSALFDSNIKVELVISWNEINSFYEWVSASSSFLIVKF